MLIWIVVSYLNQTPSCSTLHIHIFTISDTTLHRIRLQIVTPSRIPSEKDPPYLTFKSTEESCRESPETVYGKQMGLSTLLRMREAFQQPSTPISKSVESETARNNEPYYSSACLPCAGVSFDYCRIEGERKEGRRVREMRLPPALLPIVHTLK